MGSSNDGTVLEAPFRLATLNAGFFFGLVPPTVGWAWQLAQLFELKRGPSPLLGCPEIVPVTESIATKRACAAEK